MSVATQEQRDTRERDDGDDSVAQLSREALVERLRASDEWNVRLQLQLQELLQLPRSDVDKLRAHMQDADVAIPLLQCYDAALAERADTAAQLRDALAAARAACDRVSAERDAQARAAREAEAVAQRIGERAAHEAARADAALRTAQGSAEQLRHELARALASEQAAKRDAEHANEQLRAAAAAAAAATQPCPHTPARTSDDSDADGDTAQARTAAAMQPGDGDDKDAATTHEALRVQLQLLRKENADKADELDALRGRMVQTLRRAADNHATHMRAVEERHRGTVAELRALLRAHELELTRVRGQLARCGGSNAAADHHDAATASDADGSGTADATADVAAAQAQRALHAEVRQLRDELATLQSQRDEAVLRCEQLACSVRRDHEAQLFAARQELHDAQRSAATQRAACAQSTMACEQARATAAALRDKLRASEEQRRQALADKAAAEAATAEAQAREAQLRERLAKTERDANDAAAAARQRAQATQQRVDETVAELRAAQRRCVADAEAAQRERDTATQELRNAQGQLREREAAIEALRRQHAVLEREATHWRDAAAQQRQALRACEERARQLQQQLDSAQAIEHTQILAAASLDKATDTTARPATRAKHASTAHQSAHDRHAAPPRASAEHPRHR